MFKLDKTAPQASIGYVFLLTYIVLTMALLVVVVLMTWNTLQLPEWANTLLSGIWGGYTAKITTIIDYYFGSSAHKATTNVVPGEGTTVSVVDTSITMTTDKKEE